MLHICFCVVDELWQGIKFVPVLLPSKVRLPEVHVNRYLKKRHPDIYQDHWLPFPQISICFGSAELEAKVRNDLDLQRAMLELVQQTYNNAFWEGRNYAFRSKSGPPW
jgi:hypothetical protein